MSGRGSPGIFCSRHQPPPASSSSLRRVRRTSSGGGGGQRSGFGFHLPDATSAAAAGQQRSQSHAAPAAKVAVVPVVPNRPSAAVRRPLVATMYRQATAASDYGGDPVGEAYGGSSVGAPAYGGSSFGSSYRDDYATTPAPRVGPSSVAQHSAGLVLPELLRPTQQYDSFVRVGLHHGPRSGLVAESVSVVRDGVQSDAEDGITAVFAGTSTATRAAATELSCPSRGRSTVGVPSASATIARGCREGQLLQSPSVPNPSRPVRSQGGGGGGGGDYRRRRWRQ